MDNVMPTAVDTNLAEIKNPSRYMTLTYIVSLSIIAALSLVVHFMLDKVITEQAKSGELINVSGQQRMLSQRTGLFAMEYLVTGSEEAREAIDTTVLRLKQNHEYLLNEHNLAIEAGKHSPLSPELKALYFGQPVNVDQKLEDYLASIKDALDNTLVPASAFALEEMVFFDMAKQPMLSAFDDVVKQYERESQQRVDELRTAQQVVLVIVVLTILAEAIFIFRPMVRRISTYSNRLQHEANYDALSGLHNRRAFNNLASMFIANSKRYSQHLSMIIIDIDHFKRVNDTFGHDVGDEVITWVASKLKHHCRESDCVARFGGEEFAILLPNTTSAGALQAAEKLRQKICQKPFVSGSHMMDITISAGVSQMSKKNNSLESMLKQADNALYDAKQGGRNRVMESHPHEG